MKQLKVGNISIDFVRKDIKNLHLAVYPPTGRVRLAAPLNVNDEAMRLFAISKLTWIKKHQRKFETQERQPERKFISRENHFYQGKRFLLNVIVHDAPPKIILKGKTYLDFYVRKETTTQKRNEIMNEWYREQLKKQIPALIEKWERKIGVSVNGFGVKQMKTKWGTCNREKKRIWLNLELAKKPTQCLEYIVVHEMVHLLERKHNDRFLNYMNDFMPNWKAHKQELNRLPVSHSDWNY